MDTNTLHPADLLVETMNRIYNAGMTTTSGGNLSVLDDNGDIWITPTGIDKGSLRREDICCVKPDGTVIGPKPSVELPFHASVYRRRPELKAVLHAHPPALVAFSVARKLPETRLAAGFYRIIGELAIADYAVPGSELLGENIGKKFDEGFDTIILENHGVCLGASDMHAAYIRFETLERLAALELEARYIGSPEPLDGYVPPAEPVETIIAQPADGEAELRATLARFVNRCCVHGLTSAAVGTYSARLSDGSFITTPPDRDLGLLRESDLVRACGGLHGRIYAAHPDVNSIIEASPTYLMAFAVTREQLDVRTIPESYLQLRDMKRVPFGSDVTPLISQKTPAVLVENDCIVVTGGSVLGAFDRLEVAEATARSIISAGKVGKIVNITAAQVQELDEVFGL